MRKEPGCWRRLIGADLLSPKDFVRHAMLLAIMFAAVHMAGLRDFTAIISGTMAAPGLGAGVCALLGITYMGCYFGLVVLAPILLMAAGLLTLLTRITECQPVQAHGFRQSGRWAGRRKKISRHTSSRASSHPLGGAERAVS